MSIPEVEEFTLCPSCYREYVFSPLAFTTFPGNTVVCGKGHKFSKDELIAQSKDSKVPSKNPPPPEAPASG